MNASDLRHFQKLAPGLLMYSLASIFLLVTISAANATWKTGKFSSGLSILPTIFSLIGGFYTGWWTAAIVIVLLDVGFFFFYPDPDMPLPKKRK